MADEEDARPIGFCALTSITRPQYEGLAFHQIPRWGEAVLALQNGDPQPIGKLLRDESESVPPQVARELAKLLDPAPDYAGPRFELLARDWRPKAKRIAEKRRIHRRIAELRQSMKLEAAVAQVMDEFGIARSTAMDAWGYDDQRTVAECMLILGDLDARESLPESAKKGKKRRT